MKQKLDELVKEMWGAGIFLADAVAEVEKRYIRRAMEQSDDNQCEASRALGMHRNTLRRKMQLYGLKNGRGA